MGAGRGHLCKTICAAILLAASIATIVAVCIVYIPKDHDNGKGLKVKVTNPAAFEAGGASHHPAKEDNGVGAGTDDYILYTGKAAAFPNKDKWVSFKDMWEANKEKTIKTACSDLHDGKDNSYVCRMVDAVWRMLLTASREKETEYLHDAIQSVAKASLVDNRLILAIVMQESKGCVRVKPTNNGGKMKARTHPVMFQTFAYLLPFTFSQQPGPHAESRRNVVQPREEQRDNPPDARRRSARHGARKRARSVS